MKKLFSIILCLLCIGMSWAQDPRAGYVQVGSHSELTDNMEVYLKNGQDGNKYLASLTGNTNTWNENNNIILHNVGENQWKLQFKTANSAQYIKYAQGSTTASLTASEDEATIFTASTQSTNNIRFTYNNTVENESRTIFQLVLADGNLISWAGGDEQGAPKRNWAVYYKQGSWENLQAKVNEAKSYNDFIGEGMNKYSWIVLGVVSNEHWVPTISFYENVLTERNKTEEEVNSYVSNVQDMINGLQINQPTEGSFLRIKGENTKCFITGNGESGRVKLSNEENITTILFYDGTKLIGYNNGRGFDGTHGVASIGSFETHTFSASPYKKGLYLIKSNYNGSQVLCDGASSTDLLLNRWATENNIRSAWELTEVTSLPIAINAYGFASVNLPVAIELGDNTTAWYANYVNGSEVTLFKITGTLPANTPAILINKEAKNTTVDFEIDTTAENDDTADETDYHANLFEGTTAAKTTTSGSNYVLSGDGIKKFTGTTLKGFRAYLPVAQGQSIRSMVFEGEDVVTAIEAAEGAVPADGKAYDLNGRSVVRANGVVIVNGKTIAIK